MAGGGPTYQAIVQNGATNIILRDERSLTDLAILDDQCPITHFCQILIMGHYD